LNLVGREVNFGVECMHSISDVVLHVVLYVVRVLGVSVMLCMLYSFVCLRVCWM